MVGFDPSSNGKDDQRSSSRGIMARLGEVLVKPVASSSSDSDTDSPGPGPAPAAVKSGMTAIVASSVKGDWGSEVGCGTGRREGQGACIVHVLCGWGSTDGFSDWGWAGLGDR